MHARAHMNKNDYTKPIIVIHLNAIILQKRKTTFMIAEHSQSPKRIVQSLLQKQEKLVQPFCCWMVVSVPLTAILLTLGGLPLAANTVYDPLVIYLTHTHTRCTQV